jgi:hypothetical protein
MSAKLTILLSGMIAGDPFQGGATWAVLQYWLGLRRLGHDVYFVEPVAASALRPAAPGPSAGSAPRGIPEQRPDVNRLGTEPHGVRSVQSVAGSPLPADAERLGKRSPAQKSANAAYFNQVLAQFGLDGWGTLLVGNETVGVTYEELRAVARRADLLINISGMLTDPALTEPIPTRMYLDLDPAFNQLWHAAQGIDMRFAGHTHHVTIGLAVGTPICDVPTCGYNWIKTMQPVVLEHWPLVETMDYGLTTVGNWRGYGPIKHAGTFYGQKAHSLRRFIELPMRVDERFMPALAIYANDERDLAALAEYGWTLLDPAEVAATPDDYRRFIQGSKAEFGIAKSGYVASRCGWFSDRSVCYLASGKPVIAQETGFSRALPVGQGLFAFDSVGEVLAAIDRINGDYREHARAARGIAEEYFESDKVLSRLLEEVVS